MNPIFEFLLILSFSFWNSRFQIVRYPIRFSSDSVVFLFDYGMVFEQDFSIFENHSFEMRTLQSKIIQENIIRPISNRIYELIPQISHSHHSLRIHWHSPQNAYASICNMHIHNRCHCRPLDPCTFMFLSLYNDKISTIFFSKNNICLVFSRLFRDLILITASLVMGTASIVYTWPFTGLTFFGWFFQCFSFYCSSSIAGYR